MENGKVEPCSQVSEAGKRSIVVLLGPSALDRDENKVQEPIRKTDFSNALDPPKAFPETNFT